MRNRLHAKLLTLSVSLSLAFSGLYLQAQTASPFFFQVNPADNVFILDENCMAVFNPVIDTFYSTLNPPANIVYPPTGVNAALTGYSEGQTVTGPQIVNVAFVIGDRGAGTCRRLWDRIPDAYKHCLTFSDLWEAYQKVFPKETQRCVGKDSGETAHMERWYNTFRQRLARFVRKTLSFSKSDAYHYMVTKWFIVEHNLATSLTM